MAALLRSLLPPLFSLAFMMIASGLFNTFNSIRLELEGYGPEVVGFVASSLYIGILIGSLKIDRWVIETGHIRSFVVLATLFISLVLLQAFWINAWYWAFLRLLGGICTAGIFVIIESWVLMQSAPNMRGGILSIYLAVFYGALALGQLLIDVTDPLGVFPFLITALIIALSILPISLKKVTEPLMKENIRLNLLELLRLSPIGFIGGVVSGMLLATTFGLMPLYAKNTGMNISEVGTFMAVLIFGGFSLQWPVGRWADRTDRRCVIQVMSFLSAFFALTFIWTPKLYLLRLILAWFFGGFSFTLYPLSMARACEKVQDSQIIAATGGFVLSYGIGAISGPLLAPIAMNLFGPSGIFYYLAAITSLLGLVGFYGAFRK